MSGGFKGLLDSLAPAPPSPQKASAAAMLRRTFSPPDSSRSSVEGLRWGRMPAQKGRGEGRTEGWLRRGVCVVVAMVVWGGSGEGAGHSYQLAAASYNANI